MTEPKSPEINSSRVPSEADQSQGQPPYENIISQVVTKVRNEPFLFVIAIVAFLIGLTVVAAEIGSPDLRFIVIVIALLAVAVILGYYILAGLQMRAKLEQEARRHQQLLEAIRQDQSPSTAEIRPGTTDTARQAAGPPDANKFTIQASGATIGAIGDHAKVEQHVDNPNPLPIGKTPTVAPFTSQEQSGDLEQQLSQHQRNLARLRTKKAVYASGEEPLSLLNQIEDEEREVYGLQAALGQLPQA